jgi:hypothetical protein
MPRKKQPTKKELAKSLSQEFPTKRKASNRGPKRTASALANEQAALLAFELLSSGYTQAEIAAKLKCSVGKVWGLVEQAMGDYRERLAESVEKWIALEWARLQRQEEGIWRNIRLAESAALTEEGEINFGAIANLYGKLSALNRDRLALLERIDPGVDHSLDTAVSFVVVKDRQALPQVIDAVDFAQRVVHDRSTEEVEEVEGADDEGSSSS